MDALKLTALDEDDLQVISTHLQDAIMRAGDMTYLAGEKRFTAILNRFDWQGAQTAKRDSFQRGYTGLDFGAVLGVRTRNIHSQTDDVILSLLSVSFQAGEAPSGTISLTFAGGGEIELDVECIEARMSDLGSAWATKNRPEHGFEDD